MAFVVILKNNTNVLAVKANWVENPVLNDVSLIFYSQNENDVANFTLPPQYHLRNDSANCYQARVMAQFGKFQYMNERMTK